MPPMVLGPRAMTTTFAVAGSGLAVAGDIGIGVVSAQASKGILLRPPGRRLCSVAASGLFVNSLVSWQMRHSPFEVGPFGVSMRQSWLHSSPWFSRSGGTCSSSSPVRGSSSCAGSVSAGDPSFLRAGKAMADRSLSSSCWRMPSKSWVSASMVMSMIWTCALIAAAPPPPRPGGLSGPALASASNRPSRNDGPCS